MSKSRDMEKSHFEAICDAIDANEPEPERHIREQLDGSLREAVKCADPPGPGAVA